MKKSLIGSLIGICIVVTIDLLSRVVIALYMKEDILMFSYSNYPGLLWPVLLTVIAGFSTLFGGMFALTYGRVKQVFTVTLFTSLIILIRYGQIHILFETETILYPILTFTLSLLAVFLAWKIIHKPKEKHDEFNVEENSNETALRNEVNRPH
jgi:Na+(H+)/acetate symporter ActP